MANVSARPRRLIGGMTGEERKVIFASSLGTVFEWYDFYLYGSLAAIIAKQFFSGVNPTAGFIFALLAFAAGFAVRPFGALVFGRLGDLVGRKYTFLITIMIMGLSTFLVGLLPSYASDRRASRRSILIVLRLLQGLALGGEYGGAATYVAEHAPHGRRGLYTSWIQTTATLGLFLSLLVILGCRAGLDAETLSTPGAGASRSCCRSCCWRSRSRSACSWRVAGVPRNEGGGHALESAAHRVVWPMGQRQDWCCWRCSAATAGQAVVWYCGQFYALFFLTQTLKVDRDRPIC